MQPTLPPECTNVYVLTGKIPVGLKLRFLEGHYSLDRSSKVAKSVNPS